MFHLAWPWMLLLLPLPWLSRRLLPAAPRSGGGALFVPFAPVLGDGGVEALQRAGRPSTQMVGRVAVLAAAGAGRGPTRVAGRTDRAAGNRSQSAAGGGCLRQYGDRGSGSEQHDPARCGQTGGGGVHSTARGRPGRPDPVRHSGLSADPVDLRSQDRKDPAGRSGDRHRRTGDRDRRCDRHGVEAACNRAPAKRFWCCSRTAPTPPAMCRPSRRRSWPRSRVCASTPSVSAAPPGRYGGCWACRWSIRPRVWTKRPCRPSRSPPAGNTSGPPTGRRWRRSISGWTSWSR